MGSTTRSFAKPRVYKFVSPLVIFMSLFLIKYGPAVLVDSINSTQGLFLMILFAALDTLFNKDLVTVEQKLTTVALTRLICKSPLLLDPAASENLGKLVDSIVQLLTNPDQAETDLEDDVVDVPETIEYTGSFAKLHSAGKKADDPMKEIHKPKQFFASSLAGLSEQFPGRFGPVIHQFVSLANQTALVQLCGTYNSAIFKCIQENESELELNGSLIFLFGQISIG